MYLESLKIKNYKGIKNITIDFTANKNGIEKDVKISRFKIVNSKAIPFASVLVGHNSIGKTSIVEAISFVADVATGFLSRIIVDQLIKDEFRKNANHLNVNPFDVQVMSDEMQKVRDLEEKIRNSIKENKGIYYEKYRIHFFDWYQKYHKKNSFNINENISVELFFVSEEQESRYHLFLDKEGRIQIENNGNIEAKKIINFFKHSILPKRFYVFDNIDFLIPKLNQIMRSSFYRTRKEDNLSIIIINLLNLIGEKKTIKLLKLCDPMVVSLKYKKQLNGVVVFNGLVLENGSLININDLSSGSIEFISIAEAILKITHDHNNHEGLIIIDEIEKNLHKELVQTLIYMLRMAFKNNDLQSIITTHNPFFLTPEISTKQIFSIDRDNDTQDHFARKVSSFMKPHENISTKYEAGLIAPYPDPQMVVHTISEIMNE